MVQPVTITVKDAVNEALLLCGMDPLSSVVTNTSNSGGNTARVMVKLLNQCSDHLLNAFDFEQFVKTYTHTCVSGSDQGNIITLIPDFFRFIPDSFKIVGNGLKVNKATPNYYTTQVARGTIGSGMPCCTIMSDRLYTLGTQVTQPGTQIIMLYINKNWLRKSNGVYQNTIGADDDVILFDRRLVINYLAYNFMSNQGGDGVKFLADFEAVLKEFKATNTVANTIYLSSNRNNGFHVLPSEITYYNGGV